ncbi:hypothetical protein LDENG_00058220, partial [Lucifuga dentata]
MEFARHMEELARSVPLPPLILNCRNVMEESPAADLAKPGAAVVSGQLQALGLPSSDGKGMEEEEEEALLSRRRQGGDGGVDITVTVHQFSESEGEEKDEQEEDE